MLSSMIERLRSRTLGFTLIIFSHLIHTCEREDDETYIQASQAQLFGN